MVVVAAVDVGDAGGVRLAYMPNMEKTRRSTPSGAMPIISPDANFQHSLADTGHAIISLKQVNRQCTRYTTIQNEEDYPTMFMWNYLL